MISTLEDWIETQESGNSLKLFKDEYIITLLNEQTGAFFLLKDTTAKGKRLTVEYVRELERERDTYEKLAKSWMRDYTKLKEKYEPLILVES